MCNAILSWLDENKDELQEREVRYPDCRLLVYSRELKNTRIFEATEDKNESQESSDHYKKAVLEYCEYDISGSMLTKSGVSMPQLLAYSSGSKLGRVSIFDTDDTPRDCSSLNDYASKNSRANYCTYPETILEATHSSNTELEVTHYYNDSELNIDVCDGSTVQDSDEDNSRNTAGASTASTSFAEEYVYVNPKATQNHREKESTMNNGAHKHSEVDAVPSSYHTYDNIHVHAHRNVYENLVCLVSDKTHEDLQDEGANDYWLYPEGRQQVYSRESKACTSTSRFHTHYIAPQ